MRFRIGTRGSPLALAQARETRARLAAAQGWTPDEADERLELVIVKTSGDKVLDRPLAEVGGKGLFVKELEEAMLDGRVDIAVHSMKDVPGTLPPGFLIGAALPREDARDALIGAPSFAALPPGARVGTTSPRRAAQMLNLRPDLAIVLFRGNVQTRLDKLARGDADATLLAMAGLHRLGLTPDLTPLDPEGFLPAAGQGCIGLEVRADDAASRDLAASISDPMTAVALAAERACLAELDGSCRSAIAIHARTRDGGFVIDAAVFSPDGRERADAGAVLSSWPPLAEAEALGRDLALRIRAEAAHLIAP